MGAIHGVALVRDEDLVVAWSLGNVLHFCDHILVLNNRSRDRTAAIVRELAARHSHVEVVDVDDAYDTHRFVEPWAGRDIWAFKVDGDEIYDRDGLARFRARLLSGEFDHLWCVRGQSFHLVGGDLETAVGYASPPSKSVADILNFAAIEAWPSSRSGGNERLHGRSAIRFRPGRGERDEFDFKTTVPWERCDFRNLHLCFLPRSSLAEPSAARMGPGEAMRSRRGLRGLWRRLTGRTSAASRTKRRRYARGDPVARELAGFGRPSDYLGIDPFAGDAEAALRSALAGGTKPGA